MVVAGSVNVTPRSEAQREATPAARPRTGGVLLPSFADTAQEAMPSVVSITSTDIVKGNRGRRYQNPFGEGDPFEFFFGPPGGGGPNRRGQRPDDEEHKEVQGGTGFIISEDGYVVTNNHVIEGADKIEVRVNNREKYPAKLVGKDPATDLALLKIDVKQRLTPLPLGDSDRVRVGEWVMAIGDPLNFDKTVTVGVVSAKDRSGLTADAATRSFENYIQTDAAINFGNSGGPLLNIERRGRRDQHRHLPSGPEHRFRGPDQHAQDRSCPSSARRGRSSAASSGSTSSTSTPTAPPPST